VVILKGRQYNGYGDCAGEGTYRYGGANEACVSYYGMTDQSVDQSGQLLTSIAYIPKFCADTGKWLLI
jgi:hypothetical protein